jgi:RNA polymerase sigma-70 factor (ECF subfamily)
VIFRESSQDLDERLTAAVASGDHAAFEELYRRYARPLAAYGARILRDRSRGEDVAQTALMRAYDALRRGTEPLRVKPWLYKIALNTALELRAKTGEVSDGETADLEDTSRDLHTARADILCGLQDLPERQRKVFVLREIKGLPVGEVALRLELTNQQVEQALFAARNRLAEVLVFGERVDCTTLRGLDRSQLTHYERRALKGHLRGCQSCRRESGYGLSAIGFWLRDAWAWLTGGGASAAKLGAVAMTATVVGGAPVVLPAVSHRVLPHDAKAAAGEPHARAALERPARVVVPPFARRPSGLLSVVRAAAQPFGLDPLTDLPIVDEEPLPLVEPIEAAAQAAGAEAQESVPPPSRAEAMTTAGTPPAEDRPLETARDPKPVAQTNPEFVDVSVTGGPTAEPSPDERAAESPSEEAPPPDETSMNARADGGAPVP